jgi:hypothetical protein
MCLSYITKNTCPECRTLFRRSTTRVPCWNGSVNPWRIHRNGLSCRSSRYDRGPDQTRLDELCASCACVSKRRALPPPAPSYNYRHGYMGRSSVDVIGYSDSRRDSTTTLTHLLGASDVRTTVSRNACAANRNRYSLPPNAWAGCAEVQVDGPRTRWCH